MTWRGCWRLRGGEDRRPRSVPPFPERKQYFCQFSLKNLENQIILPISLNICRTTCQAAGTLCLPAALLPCAAAQPPPAFYSSQASNVRGYCLGFLFFWNPLSSSTTTSCLLYSIYLSFLGPYWVSTLLYPVSLKSKYQVGDVTEEDEFRNSLFY